MQGKNMRPLFTIHAGEFLVGEYIERNFRNTNLWVPSKDSGIDLLVTNKNNTKSVSLQVKYSRDFLVTDLPAQFQKPLRACGWWTFNPDKLKNSAADYWVLVIIGFDHRTNDYIIIKPKELYGRLQKLNPHSTRLQTYLWITKGLDCWETRGLRREEQLLVANGKFNASLRNFKPFLNNWEPVNRLN